MEFLQNPNIDFMKYRRFFVVVSLALLVVAVTAIFVHGKLNIGIDFAGGTQITLRFQEEPQVEEIRRVLAGAGFDDAQIQRFGEEAVNEVLIKTPLEEDDEEGSQKEILAALDQRFNPEAAQVDLNRSGADVVGGLLLNLDPEGLTAEGGSAAESYYGGVGEAVIDARAEEGGIFTSWDEVAAVDELSPAAADALREEATLGRFALLAAESVGPQIGQELRTKGILAVVLSLAGMLFYIWFRFELRFGVGALAAVVHDVLVVLGLYALMDFEFNLTTIAAFLTLVGYSVNDTVVIFDRVRENLRRSRRESFVDTLNKSINQSLSRTVLTSGTTLLAVGALFVLGGDVLRGFSFVLVIGVVVGTYSSVYVASPFALLWEERFGASAKLRKETAKAA